MSLTDDLLSQLQGAPLQQVSQQLGLDSQQASGAISAALPEMTTTMPVSVLTTSAMPRPRTSPSRQPAKEIITASSRN